MKQLVFATVLIFSIALASYGKPGDKKTSLVKNLTTAMRSSQNMSVANYEAYKKTSFSFNEKLVSAYFDIENDDLIGFSIPMLATDLPAGSMEAIEKRYSQYSYQEALMFINEAGGMKWFVSMTRAKKPTIILEVNAKGKVSYYAKK